MIRGIIIGILTLGVASVSYWGYQEHREKNAILIQAENNYQRAFHDLTYQLDLLQDKIGTTLAMNSPLSLSPALAEVWRITSEAHSDVGQLPLTLLPFNKTEEFLSKIGEFSYRTAIRDLNNQPLSKDEYETLKTLYGNAAEIQSELRKVQYLVLENNLRWMDVELALSTGDEQMDNTIIDGFKTVEKNVEGYSETNLGPTFTSLDMKNEGLEQIKGEKIDEAKAQRIAINFLGLKGDEKINISENADGSNYDFYSLTIQDNKSKANTYMDITKKGGYPIWVIQDREIKEQQVSLNDAANKAATFLKKNKFENQQLFESAQYGNTGVFTFVTEMDGVRIYPDSINMKVALDKGNIIGFSARDYLTAKRDRAIPQPTLTVEQAKENINPDVTIMEERQAIIVNNLGEEVLCFEFIGTIDSDTYRIFINAENGFEEKVEKLKNAEPIYEQL
ncbi:germination protein YpeB [Cytobacillus sp. IB215665]|uniref:germination protein YpeB n=1 Tax=Cytobacillus sp. IB215665 TaxID=3097357 RepID=UPI002A0D4B01|nr:germination protein YpeB [Cytobacillus sp. IB215665]MDX8364830.1 germination protein YpeB [Cytobacillus sp. IB215665]